MLATGGGAVLSAREPRLLADHGTVVYLRAAVSDLWQRTRHDRNRPLLQTADPQGKLQELFEQRDPLYREIADIIVDTGNQSVRSLAHRIEQKLLQPETSRRGTHRRRVAQPMIKSEIAMHTLECRP